MTITMYDNVNVSALPEGAQAYAGYVAGYYETWPALTARFPDALLLSISPFASTVAACLDVETGDATISQVYGWYQLVKGSYPCPVIYTSGSNLSSLIATMSANGIARNQYLIWSAHYTYSAHICGPGTCGYPQADGTQWTDQAGGNDESLLASYFFTAITQANKPTPKPVLPQVEDDVVIPPQPANSPTIATGVSFDGTPYSTVGFLADPGVLGGGTVTVRCAFHNTDGAFAVVNAVMNPSASKAVVNVPANTDGVSFTRLDNLNCAIVPNFA